MSHCVIAPTHPEQLKAEARRRNAPVMRTYVVLKVWSADRKCWEAGDPAVHGNDDGIVAHGATYARLADPEPVPAPGTPLCMLHTCANVAEYVDATGRLYCRHDARLGTRAWARTV